MIVESRAAKRRRRSRLLITGSSAAVLAVAGITAGAVPAAATTQAPTQRVVVLLRDQVSSTPPDAAHFASRRAKVLALQHDVLAALPGTAPASVHDFALGDALSVAVTPAQRAALAANPAVALVEPDEHIVLAAPEQTAAQPGKAAGPGIAKKGLTVSDAAQPICPSSPDQPLLEPEALSSIHAAGSGATAAQLATGAGVTVGYIADGIDPDNPDFVRADGSRVIVDSRNFAGNPASGGTAGEEAFGDAASIAAQGRVTYDLSGYVNPAHPLPVGCDIRIQGVAPGADLVALDAVESGQTTISDLLQSIDYAVGTAHVNVLNESFGQNAFPDAGSREAIELFNDQAMAAGVTVVVAAGDAGRNSTIGVPAADPAIISVGASTDLRQAVQTGADGSTLGHGTWTDDNLSAISSGGFTQSGGTVDLLAPGEQGWEPCTATAQFSQCVNESGQPSNVRDFGGTSEAAPLTAATAALVIQAYRSTHDGASPTPAQVKLLLTSTARTLGLPAQEQGAGLLDARAAVEAALTYPGASSSPPTGVASRLLLSSSGLTAQGAPGSVRMDKVTATNVGTAPLNVSAAVNNFRDLGPTTNFSVPLDASADPTFAAADGTAQAYRKATFTVGAHTDLLDLNATWPGAPPPIEAEGGQVSISLFDPSGRLVADSDPQGDAVPADYANLTVRQPAAGTWTVLAYTPTAAPFHGDVLVSARQQQAVVVPAVSPSAFTLQPGQSRTVVVTSTFPAESGDSANSLTFASSAGQHTAVPIILRTLIPIAGGSGSFAGSITGGNGRSGAPNQTFSYAFDVPPGTPGLNVSVTMGRDEGDILEGALIDPNGETPSIATNDPQNLATANPDGTDPSLTLSAANPPPGRWRFVLATIGAVSGEQLTMPFTGTVSLHSGVTVHTQGLPDAAATVLPQGTVHPAALTVTNTSPATIYLQTDARTTTVQTLALAPRLFIQTPAPQPTTLPLSLFSVPGFLVPPQTTSITATDTSTVPTQVEAVSTGAQGAWGGVNAIGNLAAAQAGATTSTATLGETSGYVGQGDWLVAATEIGPFGPNGAPAAQANLGMTATTLGFDHAVTSTTGDPYTESIDASDDPGTPIALAPGGSTTITLSITPDAPPGTVMRGLLNLVTPGDATEFGRAAVELAAPSGDVLATLPYQYTVGSPQPQ